MPILVAVGRDVDAYVLAKLSLGDAATVYCEDYHSLVQPSILALLVPQHSPSLSAFAVQLSLAANPLGAQHSPSPAESQGPVSGPAALQGPVWSYYRRPALQPSQPKGPRLTPCIHPAGLASMVQAIPTHPPHVQLVSSSHGHCPFLMLSEASSHVDILCVVRFSGGYMRIPPPE